MEHLPQIGWQRSVQKTCPRRLRCSEQHGDLARSGWSRPPEILIIIYCRICAISQSFLVWPQSLGKWPPVLCQHQQPCRMVGGHVGLKMHNVGDFIRWETFMEAYWANSKPERKSDMKLWKLWASTAEKLSWESHGQVKDQIVSQWENCENCGQVQQRNYHESLMGKLRIRSIVSEITVKTGGKYSRDIVSLVSQIHSFLASRQCFASTATDLMYFLSLLLSMVLDRAYAPCSTFLAWRFATTSSPSLASFSCPSLRNPVGSCLPLENL